MPKDPKPKLIVERLVLARSIITVNDGKGRPVKVPVIRKFWKRIEPRA